MKRVMTNLEVIHGRLQPLSIHLYLIAMANTFHDPNEATSVHL